MNVDVQSDLSTLELNQGEQLEGFHIRILILQQEINLSEETSSTTIIILKYTNEFSKYDKLNALISSNMTYLITFPDNN